MSKEYLPEVLLSPETDVVRLSWSSSSSRMMSSISDSESSGATIKRRPVFDLEGVECRRETFGLRLFLRLLAFGKLKVIRYRYDIQWRSIAMTHLKC